MNEINFFGKEGLTSTSANYISNLAKEYYQNLETEIANIKFYTTTVKLIGSDKNDVISKHTSEIASIPDKIKDIAECKSLIAWFRSAIKEKDKLTQEIINYSFENWKTENNINLRLEHCKNPITEQEYLDSLPVKERNRWLTVEAIASTIGKIIHKDGPLSKARKDLIDKNQNPTKVEANGRDTLIYSYLSAYSIEDIDDLFFKLQTEQRAAQAELNGMKHKMEVAIEEDAARKREEYNDKLIEYTNKQEKYLNQYKQCAADKKKEIKELKIVIPNNLRDIYNKINSLGK